MFTDWLYQVYKSSYFPHVRHIFNHFQNRKDSTISFVVNSWEKNELHHNMLLLSCIRAEVCYD